jgi:hypothetical protein
MRDHVPLGALCAAILLLPACGPQYQNKALIPMRENTAQYQETKNQVTVYAKRLNRSEANALFDGRGKYLFSTHNPIYPIQITVVNKSADEISFDPTKITLKFANPKNVANRLQYQTVFNTVGIIAAGILGFVILAPLTMIACLSGSATAGIAILGGKAALAGLLVITPTASIYYGNAWSKANQRITTDLNCKTARKSDTSIATIKPEEELSCILFADGKSFNPQFDVTIQKNNHAIIFNANLPQLRNN